LGLALVAGKKRVPMPATGNTALVSGFVMFFENYVCDNFSESL
jgi:hypothetical protein